MASGLQVTRLLQNPLGQVAPEGVQGDIVRVSNGDKTIYLTLAEFSSSTEDELRQLLAAAPRRRPV